MLYDHGSDSFRDYIDVANVLIISLRSLNYWGEKSAFASYVELTMVYLLCMQIMVILFYQEPV